MPATKTLPQCAHDAIESAIDEAADDDPVVLWWDDGGYLRDIIESESSSLGCEFRAAERTALELRTEAPRQRTVWYVPQEQTNDVDWFKDVEHTGGVIKRSIEDLAVRCFENERVQAWELREAAEAEDEEGREEIAKILYRELSGEGGLPTLQGLRTKIITGGHTDPVQFVLENGWEGLPDKEDDIADIRELLVDNGVEAVAGETDADAIVYRTRRWAVAEWLVDEGMDPGELPPEYRPTSTGGFSVPELRAVLNKTERAGELAEVYLDPDHRFWHDVLRNYENPWGLVDCPVDASLEHRLWDEWTQLFGAGEYEICASRAESRYERLDQTYGDVPWTQIWKQAIDVADLAHELETWEDRSDTGNVVDLYGDVETGTWQIDNAVFSLIISGEPEQSLPEEHPATATLEEFRTSLVETRYLEYLTELGDLVVDQVEAGSPFVDEDHAYQFFQEEQEYLQSGQSVALFIIDALRFDLAHELAESIRREHPRFEVDENTWVGTLPSDTKFGKAALTPGNPFTFKIRLRNGELIPERNGRHVTNHRREELLRNDGWSYITQDGDESGWSNTRVAYYWNDIDEAGEKELTDFESLFTDRVETLSRIICEKLDQGEWDRAYILTDHGFVSLPERVSIDDLHPPDAAEAVTRRWIVGENVDDGPGVTLDESAHLGYLEDNINVLADPLQRFRKQGLGDARFYHGGVLPQEFVLNFVTITQE